MSSATGSSGAPSTGSITASRSAVAIWTRHGPGAYVRSHTNSVSSATGPRPRDVGSAWTSSVVVRCSIGIAPDSM